jgi:hypothetical protein
VNEEESDLLSWNKHIEYATLGSFIEKSLISKEITCSNNDSQVYTIVYPKKLNFGNARLICNHLGGFLSYPEVKPYFTLTNINFLYFNYVLGQGSQTQIYRRPTFRRKNAPQAVV